MNYKKHYESLIERARVRKTEQYTETHHVVPKCLGGASAMKRWHFDNCKRRVK